MARKRVDERIRTLIQNGVRTKHRSMFVIIGDKSLYSIVNLYYLLHKETVGKSSTNFMQVLWCYRDKLELSSHKEKQARQLKARVLKRYSDSDEAGTFSHFLETTRIEYCRYKDSDRILGNTYGMCILQDFESLTPNLLAKTLETVEGGGLIVLLLRTLPSLTCLYTMVMDVHARFRTESHPGEATKRFNERFILSLASCKSCIVTDDELTMLPVSSHMKSVTPVPIQEDLSEAKRVLEDLKERLKDCFPVGPLMKKCCTMDQGKAVMNFIDVILGKTPCHTVALLAARGRGKSAALGLAIAGAVAAGYSNIFVTAPSPESLKTLFQFVSKGFDMLKYKEHLDYDIVRSSDPELKNVVIRINIYKQHRQTIQYIQPHEHGKLSQVELLVVDEAAAIPLPVVKSLLGPYLVFLSSTVNGYEGTGRSLYLKLSKELKKQRQASTNRTDVPSGQLFKKIKLSEAIRYAPGDPIEFWLNDLLCLNIANSFPETRSPLPSECGLYYVNRDTLFSRSEKSELVLQRMMALFAASQYKNSPDDLQLLADAPAHQLFVLLGPFDNKEFKIEDIDILCVIQVCLEGSISKESVMSSLSAGHQPSGGDQIPWKFCEQFQDTNFASLSGARIVRIATHPDAILKQGYASAAIELLARYFKGQFVKINSSKSKADVKNVPKSVPLKITEAAKQLSLLEENIKPRSDLPLLFERLDERQPPEINLHYLGVSFGLTSDLFRFWRKQKFVPFYISEVPNSLTGEHTCMMLKTLDTDDVEFNIDPFYRAFRAGFTRRLSSPAFNTMEYKLAMRILEPKLSFTNMESTSVIPHGGIYDDIIKSPISMRKLEAYVTSLGHNHHLMSDLKVPLAYLYFQEKLPVELSEDQASVLLCMGLQNQDVSYVEGVMSLERQTILVYFMQVMKKFYHYLKSVTTQQFTATLPPVKKAVLRPHPVSVDEDLVEAAKKVKDDFKVKSGGLLNSKLLQYAISDKDVDFENALQNRSGSLPSGGIISVKSNKTKAKKHDKSDRKPKKKRKTS